MAGAEAGAKGGHRVHSSDEPDWPHIKRSRLTNVCVMLTTHLYAKWSMR